ncbi:hypothetical protein Q4485_05535 [Granulosicoccaceae sp. 1_MG-2023]|nr:hypothetical protein [Granulosicoccaceae sp. 1_MG-2023]
MTTATFTDNKPLALEFEPLKLDADPLKLEAEALELEAAPLSLSADANLAPSLLAPVFLLAGI